MNPLLALDGSEKFHELDCLFVSESAHSLTFTDLSIDMTGIQSNDPLESVQERMGGRISE